MIRKFTISSVGNFTFFFLLWFIHYELVQLLFNIRHVKAIVVLFDLVNVQTQSIVINMFFNLVYLERTQFFVKKLYLILGNSIQEKKYKLKLAILFSFRFLSPIFFLLPSRPYITILIMNVPRYLQNTYSDSFDAKNILSNAPF